MEKKRILIIDDEKPILDMLKLGLEMRPEFDVVISEKMEEYKTLLFSESFDVIMLDHRMPLIEGSTLGREIREKEGPNRETPIIFISGNIREVKAEVEFLSNAHFMQKPLILNELFDLLLKC